MGLREEITRFIQNIRGQQPETSAEPSDKQPNQTHYAPDLLARFSVENDRASRVRESRKIYDEDGRFEEIVNTLARDVTKGRFQIEVDDEAAAEVAEAMRNRLALDDRLDDWARLTFRDGDSFIEAGVTKDRLLVDATRKPTLHMRRNSDKLDRFSDPVHAFWYADNIMQLQTDAKTIWFAEWQIIHARWMHDEGDRYGTPLMNSGRKTYKKIDQGELNVAIRRHLRSGRRYHHYVKGDGTDIETYKAQNKQALSQPNAQADFFSNYEGGISTVAGDDTVGDINDIVHFIETWWIGSPVPRGLLGYGRDLNRDVLKSQKEQYDETLESVKKWLADQLIKPFLELQWLLAGYVPELLNYKITFPSKKIVTPQDILTILEAAQLMRLLGFPEDVIRMVVARFMPEIDPEMLASNEPVGAGNDAQRLAAIDRLLTSLRTRAAEQQPGA